MVNFQKTCWIICDDGKVGTEHQCVGLANSLGLQPKIIRVQGRGIWKYLPASLWTFPLKGMTSVDGPLRSPWPDIIIGAGRLSAAPVAYIRKITQGQTKVIQLLNPRINPKCFDLVVAPEHDGLIGPNVLQTRGALHLLTQERLNKEGKRFSDHIKNFKKPLVAVLIGGRSHHYPVKSTEIFEMAQRLKRLANTYHAHLMVTFSRRTSQDIRQIFQETLKDTSALVWTREDDNPYYAFLSLANYIIVTCDSISMTSEACFTGKPVYSYFFKGGSQKFHNFHQAFQAQGYTRSFKDQLEPWSYPPLNELSRITDIVRQYI
ncbi:MAG: mitochondrial fission ELM1 family protein [Janthinobacterium lividum]